MRRPLLVLVPVLAVVLAGCGQGAQPNATETKPASGLSAPTEVESSPEAAATPPTMLGNAATNPACALLSVEQVAANANLPVTGLRGLVGDTHNPDKHSESCTWYLDSKDVQSSLVLQYTLFSQPPSDVRAYYPQVIEQGFGKAVPNLGDISKIYGHALDTVFKRAEIHVTLLTHAEATPADQAAAIAIMRLVLAGLPQ
ncbi:MAG: hypothetical protein ABIO67_00785 [Mycobacteriales bacterium]